MPRAPKLVIFDCDGVLVDSEVISVGVLTELVRRAGAEIADGDGYRLFLGRSMAAVEKLLRKDYALALSRAELDGVRAETFRRFRAKLKPMPGVAEALSRLKRGVALRREQPERIGFRILTGLLEILEPHIQASMVARGKPAPDLFLLAAGDGRSSGGCVVEDSPAGIDAARRAGMRLPAQHATAEAAGLETLSRGCGPN